MERIIFINSFLNSDNGKKFDMYNEKEVRKLATKENIELLERVESTFDDDNVVGYIYKDNCYIQVYKEEIAKVRGI